MAVWGRTTSCALTIYFTGAATLGRLADVAKHPVPGTFKLTLEFAEDYPNKAPVVKIVSAMFHPNGATACL